MEGKEAAAHISRIAFAIPALSAQKMHKYK